MRIGANSRVLVTGASSGIGLACAEACAGRGATVGMLARRAEVLTPLAERIGAQPLIADVTDAEALSSAIASFAGPGGIDLLIANAGIAHYGPFADQPFEHTEAMVATNVLGVIRTVDRVLPGMLERAAGHIAIVASAAALRSFPSAAVYGATKAAELAFASALRHELSGSGVSVTTMLPGEVQTALHDHQPALMPDWRKPEEAVPAAQVAEALLAGVEADRREVSIPPKVRLLGLSGIAPRLTDQILARLRGGSAAPRRRD